MKKLHKIGLISALGLGVIGYAFADSPSDEYSRLNKWINSNAANYMNLDALVQKAKSEGELQGLIKTKVAQLQQETDALDIQTPEIKAIKDNVVERMKAFTNASIEAFRVKQNPTEANMKAMSAKLQSADSLLATEQKLKREAKKKYDLK
ncbi:hypothetical protein BMT54_08650 [Pasteurellaceae bacterium 15-036681]|nr:hypothetical protein BMT54_08650 [Pasteurellaceae bacterium 15-036681]